MATVTRTTVEISIGEYRYRAEVDGNEVALYRDGKFAGKATWDGGTIADFPKVLSEEAHIELDAAIAHQLRKAYWARTETFGMETGPDGDPALGTGKPLTQDAGNAGQMGNELGKPSRQGEKEVGSGGPGGDPNTGETGGQAIKPHRRAAVDGFRKTGNSK